MRTFSLILILSIIVFGSCKKHKDEAVAPINCNGLVTDTTGTGDTARIYMATAFSPDANGINDVLRPIMKGMASFIFTLYDENNNVVFTSNQTSAYYPASQPSTTLTGSTKYYYKVQVTTEQGHHIGECGTVYRLACLPQGMSVNSLHLEDELTQSGFWDGTSMDPVLLSNCP